jgi:hypothetical protein
LEPDFDWGVARQIREMDVQTRGKFFVCLDDLDIPGMMARTRRELTINQAIRPMGVELERPIANDLKRDAADFRRVGTCRAFVNRRQRQEPSTLRAILRSLGRGPD